jgi:hypothetical protein
MTSHHSALGCTLESPTPFTISDIFYFLLHELTHNEEPSRALGLFLSAHQRGVIEARWSELRASVLNPPLNNKPERCKHGMTAETCSACLDAKRSGPPNPNRDKYLLLGRWCGPELSTANTCVFDVIGHDGGEDFLADEKAEEARSAEVEKQALAAAQIEKRFVTLPIVPWVDLRRETFLSLYGELLEKDRQREDIRRGELALRDGDYDRAWAARGWKHVAGIASSKFTVACQTNWCPTCNEYVVEEHDGPNGISCEEYCRLRELGEEMKRANAAWELEARNAREKAKNNRKLAARGWVGYSSDEHDLSIIAERMQDAYLRGQDGVYLTEFDVHLWNRAHRVKRKARSH